MSLKWVSPEQAEITPHWAIIPFCPEKGLRIEEDSRNQYLLRLLTEGFANEEVCIHEFVPVRAYEKFGLPELKSPEGFVYRGIREVEEVILAISRRAA